MHTLSSILRQRDLYFVEPKDTVSEVARKMASLNVGAILVLDDGELRGLFSERDLMVRVIVAERDPAHTFVAEVMTSNLATARESDTLEEAMERMRNFGCRHLPVVQGNRAVGMISMRDLMNIELEEKTEELHQMRAYIQGSV